jgi:hypothetical protein
MLFSVIATVLASVIQEEVGGVLHILETICGGTLVAEN